MKESMFNVYLLDEKEKKYLVYNTLYGSIVQIDDEVYTLIKGNIDGIDPDLLRILTTTILRLLRILVGLRPASADDLSILKS